ncbi:MULTISPECIES: AfsA-related hotdog domain-containing protein [unclassified Burkholderia]|uniref:AfsA-related hotdog domain-containing protein n=1 Tax=unclassified Burkholderia TaxID=2613784 RepID=UPI00141EE86A|nr:MULTISPECIES: AfsA-related hotdog domain-containing protein [unclassified Burkholderia]NIE82517.1 hypothetical protein [Burkholderia sp. Tr-860]NIF61294.1 hypothetical protein [Burkholderia sp. Cy-647]NIF94499.1 hypothetical protein [Burkholderia sp. Ax-1720]
MNIILIVGQRFTGIGTPDHVFGLYDFISHLKHGQYDSLQARHHLYFGQGINSYDKLYIADEIKRRALSERIAIPERMPRKAARAHVHKHLEKNILLADLESSEPNRLRARLSIDNDNELMQDHMTGWHLSGMVMLEAMRQMVIAAAERHEAISVLGDRHSFVLLNWTSSFDNFLFPLDAEVDSVLHLNPASKARRLEFRVDVRIIQIGQPVAKGTLEFAVITRDALDSLEERHARKSVQALMRSLGSAMPAEADSLMKEDA